MLLYRCFVSSDSVSDTATDGCVDIFVVSNVSGIPCWTGQDHWVGGTIVGARVCEYVYMIEINVRASFHENSLESCIVHSLNIKSPLASSLMRHRF